ncbi:MAG TPA: HAMP domain-containing sensor histidine kinase [Ktedonobacterales bacterium]
MRLLALARGPFAATRRRLLLMNLLVVSAMIGAMAVAVYAWEAQITDQQITQDVMDRAGHDTGRNVTILREPHNASDANAPVDSDPGDVYEPSSPNVFTVLLDAQGKVVSDPGNVRALGLPDMAAARPVLSGRESSTLVTVGDDEHAFRLYTSAVSDHGKVIGALQIGASLTSRSRQLHGLLMTLVLVGAGMLGLTALVSLFLTDRALAPTRAAYERERRFVAAASHELRTPLAIARSQAELVSRHLRRLSGPQDAMSEAARRELADDVDEITDEVDYMTRLVHDLLALARPESEREGSPMQAVDLMAVAEGCVTRLRPQADANGLGLSLADTGQSEHAPVMVRADADQLRRLLFILLENALAYTPSGGSITVSVETQAGRAPVVLLNVADSGKGISPEDLPHVFEPFYRADPARRHSHHSGSGLGLALARHIAHSLGGEITVKSDPGIGSMFTVRLPYGAVGDS